MTMERVYPKEVIGILVSNNYLLFDQYPSDYFISFLVKHTILYIMSTLFLQNMEYPMAIQGVILTMQITQ